VRERVWLAGMMSGKRDWKRGHNLLVRRCIVLYV